MRDRTTPFDEKWREDWDWQEAFAYGKTIRSAHQCYEGGFDMYKVAEVIAASPGENDGPQWLMAGKLKDGRFFFLAAGCDYTGWDCQAVGDGCVADTLPNLIRFCIPEEDRNRLGLTVSS